MGSNKEQSYSISKLAEDLDISPRSIRFYEERGLISPKRTSGNQRIFSKKDRARLKMILRGKRFGYSLEEISEIMGLAENDVSEKEQIERSVDGIKARISKVDKHIEELKLHKLDMEAILNKFMKRLRELDK